MKIIKIIEPQFGIERYSRRFFSATLLCLPCYNSGFIFFIGCSDMPRNINTCFDQDCNRMLFVTYTLSCIMHRCKRPQQPVER